MSTSNNDAASEDIDSKLQQLESRLLKKLKELENASKPEVKFQIAQDDRYRTLTEHALDPKKVWRAEEEVSGVATAFGTKV
jgi:hypothetical protein